MSTLLPHFNALDLHLSTLLPCGEPLVLCGIEVLLRAGAAVQPRLTADTISEPAIPRTDCHIDNKVEVLVEWSRVAVGLFPRVLETGAIGVGKREFAIAPEGLVKMRVHDLQQTRVDVGEDILLAPLRKISL